MTLADLNRMSKDAFVSALGGIFEHSPWVAERAFPDRPFPTVDALHAAMASAVRRAVDSERMALVRAHPELAGRAALRGDLTTHSSNEQSDAGLRNCSAEELARITELNARYKAKFGFPFIMAVKGYGRAEIIAEFARRIDQDRATELRECLAQIDKIARFRLDALISR